METDGNVAFRRRLTPCCFSLFSNLDLNLISGDTSFKPDPDLDDPKPGFSIRIEQVSGFSDTRNQSGAQTKGFTPFFSSKEAFQV